VVQKLAAAVVVELVYEPLALVPSSGLFWDETPFHQNHDLEGKKIDYFAAFACARQLQFGFVLVEDLFYPKICRLRLLEFDRH
jgi:hypothetical protein